MTTYAIIPSNSLAEAYPDNTTSNFTIPLSIPFEFPKNEHWRVELLEVQIPITFYNFEDHSNRSIVFKDEQGEVVGEIQNGLYNSAEEIIKKINGLYFRLGLFRKRFQQVLYKKPTHTIQINLNKGQKIVFCPTLARIFGFPEILEIENGQESQAFESKVADPWKDFHHIFIYSDLVEDRILNSDSLPLLGTVSLKDNHFGSLLVRSFLSPEVLKPRYERYSTINFQLRNQVNQLVRFRSGSVVLKLKFTNARRNQSSPE